MHCRIAQDETDRSALAMMSDEIASPKAQLKGRHDRWAVCMFVCVCFCAVQESVVSVRCEALLQAQDES